MLWFWLVTIVLALLGLVSGTFYGLKAPEIFDVKPEGKPCAWKLHQFWFNFIGAFVGWIFVWILVWRIGAFGGTTSIGYRVTQIGIVDFALAFVAFTGITGHLPYATWGILSSLQKIAVAALDWIKKLFNPG